MPERKPLIAILDYGIGNLHSAHKGFAHVGADARLTADAGLIGEADGVVLPGVGAFGPCMRALAQTGLDEIAVRVITEGRPFFGICIGMQVLFEESEEAPGVSGLGVLPGMVQLLPDSVKRPQIQWNTLDPVVPDHPMLSDLGPDPWMYFVHSFAAPPSQFTIATCPYGIDVVAAVGRDRLWAAQFHPEKSSTNGLKVLANFVNSCREGTR